MCREIKKRRILLPKQTIGARIGRQGGWGVGRKGGKGEGKREGVEVACESNTSLVSAHADWSGVSGRGGEEDIVSSD